MNGLYGQSRYSCLHCLPVLMLLLTALVGGCASPDGQGSMQPPETSGGQVVLFFNGPAKTSLDLTFELAAVSIVAEDGSARELMGDPLKVNSIAFTGRQAVLSERMLPEGKYKKLRFLVKNATIKRKNKTASLALPQEPIEALMNVTVGSDRSTPLFVSWSPEASVDEGYLFNPAFAVKGQTPELSTLLVYVTNELSNNVSVINRQTDEVVAVVKVGKKPRGVAASARTNNKRIYVANAGSNSISVIDPTTNMVENEVPVKFGREPEGIAVAELSAQRELVFVANYGSNTVSVIDSPTFQEMERVTVGNGPIAIAADPPAESLAGSHFLSAESLTLLKNFRERNFNVYVVNRNSKEVSILRVDRSAGRVSEVTTVPVEWSPVALHVDYPRGKVYVVNAGYDKLSVIDIVQLVRGNRSGAVSSINNVGSRGIGVIADPGFDRIYFLREFPGEIVVLNPFSERLEPQQRVTVPILGTIPVGAAPRNLLLDPEARKIYVVNSGSNSVSVVDKTAQQAARTIPAGKKPYGIAVLPP